MTRPLPTIPNYNDIHSPSQIPTNKRYFYNLLIPPQHHPKQQQKSQKQKQNLSSPSISIFVSPLHTLTSSILQTYGSSLFSLYIQFNNISFPPFFLNKHALSKHAHIRMIDWMFEVFSNYNSEPRTFYLSAYLFDLYLFKSTHLISDSDIHLIGITCIYIASKMEDISPLQMKHIKTSIAHDKFSESEIIAMERQILQTINFDIIYISTFDYICLILTDFYICSLNTINTFNIKQHLISIERVCIYLSILICYNEHLTTYSNVLKAVCCFILSFHILKSKCDYSMTNTEQHVIKNWIGFILKRIPHSKHDITTLFNEIITFYNEAKVVHTISPNLNKRFTL